MKNLLPFLFFFLFILQFSTFFPNSSFAQNEYTKDGKKISVEKYLSMSKEKEVQGDY